jgi:AraC-like DNA-binding protein
LTMSARSIAEIAHDAGYADQSHFTRAFRGVFRTTPQAWRRPSKG